MQNSKNLRVLIESRTPHLASIGVSAINPRLFKIDSSFAPVPIVPATVDMQLLLDGRQEQLTITRGYVPSAGLSELRHQPNVVDVHLDTELVPFSRRYGQSHSDDWLVDVCSEPAPDDATDACDCLPTSSRGCLLDAATFLGANQLWCKGVSGEGIVIGIVDGGILSESRMDPNLPGIVPRVIDGWPNSNWGTVSGWRGHGNMVAIDALGMAPRSSLYDIRISDGSPGGASMSDAIAGINWAVEKYRLTGTPQILCCGWGINQQAHDPKYARDPVHPLTRKIVEALDEGIIVLFAAGNGGSSCPASWCGDDVGPGRSIWGANGHPRVITVGAVNRDEELIGYSSQGPAALDQFKPDICGASHFAGYFSSDSGTSAACAVVSGVVALLKQVRPTLTQEAVKRLLRSTARGIGSAGWNHDSGAGVVQADAAYNKLVGYRPGRQVDTARLEQLELENRYLRNLFIELALERRTGTSGPAANSLPNIT